MNKKDTYKTKQEKASHLKHVCKYDYLLSSIPAEKPVVIMVNQQHADLVISGRKLKKVNLSSLNRTVVKTSTSLKENIIPLQ